MNKNKFYVYGHYNAADNKLFYIGKGTGNRKDSKSHRSNLWFQFTTENSWYSGIIKDSLNEAEALTLESALIDSTEGLINIHRNCQEVALQGLEDIFEYSEDSPTGLVWKTWNRQYNNCRKNANDVAGFVSHTKNGICQGYRVGYNGKEYKVHRIIMHLLGQNPANQVVDHRDGNPLNNRKENLRVVPRSLNNRNSKRKSNNTTGHVGVYLKFSRNRLIYQAKISLTDGLLEKSFSVLKHGLLPAYAKTVSWRRQQIENLNRQGAGYTERHGVEN